MTSYTNPFTGQTIQPSQVGYELLTISVDTTLQWPVNGNTSDVVANIIEVDATVASLNLYMPAATQVSTGQSALITNVGSNTFTVVDSSGNTIVSIASGIAEYIYITDNTTVDGTWSTVTFGAGTSSANAATLAGYGLKAVSTTLNQAYDVTTYYSDITLDDTQRAQFVVWDSGVGTITLPNSGTVGNNWFCMIRNNGTGILTLTPQGAETIDGNASAQLQLTESLVIVSDGSAGFNTFGYGRSSDFYYTILSRAVTGGTVVLTNAEASNIIQEYTGVLLSNCTVILPSTVQLYSLNNLTTGSYTLTFSTGATGATTLTLPQNQTALAICDGTNVYSASTASIGVLSSLTLSAGSAAAPSLNFTSNLTTGLYLPASNQIGFTAAGVNAATISSTGLSVVNAVTALGGISGGAF